jgi:cytoskeleton-associated protein 5
MVVSGAGKCLAGLAYGLKRRFDYASTCIPCILQKFGDKKQCVVEMREAIDAVFQSVSPFFVYLFVIFLIGMTTFVQNLCCFVIKLIFLQTSLEKIRKDVFVALENKNPQVQVETASFLARCFTKCTPDTLNKVLKQYTAVLLKILNGPGI